MRILSDNYIREVEVSITPRCTLACRDCGFLVPDQPKPSRGEPVGELLAGLEHLHRLGIRIGSLAILGGEPTIDGALLERAVLVFRGEGVADRIEVVSNGLTPQGVTLGTLAAIDRFTISVYGLDDILLDRWRQWLSRVALHVELSIRRNEGGWDLWSERRRVPPERAQAMYEACWYRRHCTTLERGRVFACSRIAKLARDDEGLPLTAATTFAEVEAYLHRPEALPSCATCTPMMGLPTIPAGVQPDDRIHRLQRRAIAWLDKALMRAASL
jgi:hypothetical protein